ncbi:ricin-type beta-trefoil lectin domain protein [Streptomyces griseus]|uniref:ricin-type beta-trefoil lectin domain protein n=1 Tax=Streptomyces griseus TaxID=1911 RepID=UPI00386A0A41|nr:ricin-type beta-trefoil lectin domain protein [Streptomyces fimicarius]
MTRSSQQTPASPESRAEHAGSAERAESAGSRQGEGAAGPAVSPGLAGPDASPGPAAPAAAAGTAAAAPAAPESEKAGEGKNSEAAGEATGPAATRPQSEAPEAPEASPGTPEALTRAPETQPGTPDVEPAASTGPATDPDASAAAQSRLPALVRTMTATAIDRPQAQAGPVGRPGKAVLAGAAVAGALLVSVPFLVLAGNDDDGPKRTNAAAAGTVIDGNGQEAPGEFAVTAPETSSPGDGTEGDEGKKEEKSAKPVRQVPAPASGTDQDASKTDDTAGKASKSSGEKGDSAKEQPKKSDGAKNQPAKARPAVTLSGPVSFRSHLSGRCIDVPGHNFNDGQPLFMWDCNGADAQKLRFASDGTIRARDKCLDVANANFNDGARIQLAWCNGSAAQKFTLNAAHDLVNTVVGKCVDIPNHSRGKGPETYLILWTCTGLDNQKWSV